MRVEGQVSSSWTECGCQRAAPQVPFPKKEQTTCAPHPNPLPVGEEKCGALTPPSPKGRGARSYTYDNEGNMLSRTKISDSTSEEYAWDHRNRLVKVTFKDGMGATTKTVEHAYDVYNRWIRRTVDADGPGPETATDTFFAYDGYHAVLQFDGAEANDLDHRYLFGPAVDQILADQDVNNLSSAGNTLWGLADHLGTVRDVADLNEGSGVTSVTNHRKYNSFGTQTSETNAAVDFIFGESGKMLEEHTGMNSHIHRWLRDGQWISEDPIGFGGGDANLRRDVHNSPLGFVDSDGLDAHHVVPRDRKNGTDVLILTRDEMLERRIDKRKVDRFLRYGPYGYAKSPEDLAKAAGLDPATMQSKDTELTVTQNLVEEITIFWDNCGNRRYALHYQLVNKDGKIIRTGYKFFETEEEARNHVKEQLGIIEQGAKAAVVVIGGVGSLPDPENPPRQPNEGLPPTPPEDGPTQPAPEEPGRLQPGSPEHKADRWRLYVERGGTLKYDEWSAKYDRAIGNVTNGLGREAEYRRAIGGTNKVVSTPFGKRQIDVHIIEGRRMVQIKTGYECLSKRNQLAIMKDKWLVEQGYDVEWVLENGASGQLVDELGKAGIRIGKPMQ